MAQATQTAAIPSGLPAIPTRPSERGAPIERRPGSSAAEIHARLRPHEFERRPDTVEGKAFTFKDLLDIINPLQHLPLVSGLYRSLTGDEISPHARVMGGFLYGGASGLMRASLEAVVLQETGQELTAQAMSSLSGQDGTAIADRGRPATQVMIAGSDDPGMDRAAEAEQLARQPSDDSQQAELEPEPDYFESGPSRFEAAGLRRLQTVYHPSHTTPAFLRTGRHEVIHDGPSGHPLGLIEPQQAPTGKLAGATDATGPRGLPAFPEGAAAGRPTLTALQPDDGTATAPERPAFLRRGERVDDGPSGIPMGLVRRTRPLAPPSYAELAAGAERHARAASADAHHWQLSMHRPQQSPAGLQDSASAAELPARAGPPAPDMEAAEQAGVRAAMIRYQTAQALFDARDQHR